MAKPTIKIHNATTNEVIEREMNDQEYAQFLVDLEEQKIQAKARLENEKNRQTALEKLAVLGLDESDLIALGLK